MVAPWSYKASDKNHTADGAVRSNDWINIALDNLTTSRENNCEVAKYIVSLFLSWIDGRGLAKRARPDRRHRFADTPLHDDLNTGPGTGDTW